MLPDPDSVARSTILLSLILTASACSSGGADPSTSGAPGTVPEETTTTLDPRPCRATTVIAPAAGTVLPPVERLPAGNPQVAAVAASQAAFDCASVAVVVDTIDIERVGLAAVLAASLKAPMLFAEPSASSLAAYELDRLAPLRVVMVGDVATTLVPEWADVERIEGDNAAIAAAVAEEIDADDAVVPLAAGGLDTVAATAEAIREGKTLAIAGTDDTGAVALETESLSAGPGRSGMVWLVDRNEPEAALAATAAAFVSEGFMAIVEGSDLRADTAVADLLDRETTRALQVVGGTSDAGWQARVLLRGDELPGGGFLMFPGRRMVALYGNPLTTSLGVLGEQDPAAGLARLETLSAGYGADGNQVLPTFEIIASVAAGSPGADGDYSNEMAIDLLRSWVDVAAANDAYVLLDLQPGRESFPSQALVYEELLLEPHVGLALDPEWRLGPDQFHLQQIGRVEAAEVNEVIEWLAALVRDNALPQKVLLLHQFHVDMLQDRDLIRGTPELAIVIQMDGQGAIPDKYATWARVTAGWEEDPFEYGWKNFFDEDVPGPISAAEVLELVPSTVYVSFQ